MIEVLVALGIAGGALILVLSANNASLRRSVGARGDLRVLRAVESKHEELLLGLDRSLSGELEGLPGWKWEVFRSATYLAHLKRLKRMDFVAYRPDGSVAIRWGGLREEE